MTLADYIADPARRDALAAACMTSPQWLYQIAVGWRGKRASARLARDIVRATNGQVTLSDLRPDIWPPADDDDAAQREVA